MRERRAVRRPRAGATQEPAAESSASPPGHEHPLLRMQRQAGNQAVRAAGAQHPGTGPDTPVARMLADLAPPPLPAVAPALDRTAESEADADAARLPATQDGPVRLDGDRLPPGLQGWLGKSVGDVGDVRVHAGPESTAMARSMGARAFTKGRDIHVDAAELRRRDGAKLLAHEASHAVRHGARPGGSPELVHAKLQGTHQALVNLGGGETSGKLRKLVKHHTNWDDLLHGVAAYEKLEASLLKGKRPGPKDMAAAQKKLLKLLTGIEKAALAWQKANKGDGAEALTEQEHQKWAQTSEKQKDDPRDKAARRQAIAMLLPRVRHERDTVAAGKFFDAPTLSDSTLTSTGKEDEGQKNKVQELIYDSPTGSFTGYFKEDVGFAKKIEGHELDVGIRQVDPNYGARSVASTKIDQLLKTNLLARTEFATHEGKMGTVSESAKGKKIGDLNVALTDAEKAERGGDSISMEDPVLQKALNKLQILDAICGQLDRHFGNYLIQVDDSGKVTGLTGIDLDMAFGKDMVDPTRSGEAKFAENYRGVPSQIDEELGRTLLALKAEDIRGALRGVLPDPEIEATVKRFEAVQSTVRELDQKGGLTSDWNAFTAKASRGDKATTFNAGVQSYAQGMAGGVGIQFAEELDRAMADALGGDVVDPLRTSHVAQFRDMPDVTANAIRENLQYLAKQHLKPVYWQGTVTLDGAIRVAMALFAGVLGDDSLMARIEVAVQEGSTAYAAVETTMEDRVADLLPDAIARYGAPQLSKV